MIEKIKAGYQKELRKKLDAGEFCWPDSSDRAVEKFTGRVLELITKEALGQFPHRDNLRYNPLLRKACRQLGIRTNRELREALAQKDDSAKS